MASITAKLYAFRILSYFAPECKRKAGSAIKLCLAEIIPPLGNDLAAAGLQDRHDIAQGAFGDAGMIVA